MEFNLTNKEIYERDIASQKLFQNIKPLFGIDRKNCIIYYRYPLYQSENLFVPSIVVLDREYGIFVFKALSAALSQEDLKETSLDIEEYIYNLQKEVDHPRRNLRGKIKINHFIYFPFLTSETEFANVLFGDIKSDFLSSFEKNNLTEEEWVVLLNIIQKLDPLSKNKNIKIDSPPQNLNEAILLNDQKICVFDGDQEKSALMETKGGMQIRGLAGTGKTIILAWKAAYLHYCYPDKKILYTFYTKGLYGLIKRLIIKFYKKYSESFEEPNWENLKILHAWGGKEKEGVYYNACLSQEITPEGYNDYKSESQPFEKACEKILDKSINAVYDYILVDEAQDLPPSYFRLLAKLIKGDKAITIAYDALQSLEDIQMPNFSELFGKVGDVPLIPLAQENDFILRKSYRSPMEVLHTAIALGFGIYSKQGFTQMIEHEIDWKAIGYELQSGELINEKPVELKRPSENSPNNIGELYPKIPPLKVESFLNKEEEINFIVENITNLINIEKVNPQDIFVINLPGKNVQKEFMLIQTKLYSKGINSKIPGIFDEADDFGTKDNVTLSTAMRSKGNEAPIVFVMGLEKIITSDAVWQRINRSFTFVSMTRAKGWCFLTSSGEHAKDFLEEYSKISRDFPHLKFIYPSKVQMENIHRINYITKDEKSKREYFEDIEAINRLLETGNTYFPQELLNKLKDKLDRKIR